MARATTDGPIDVRKTFRRQAMKGKAWIGALVAVAIVVAAVPQVTGRMAETRIRELVAAANTTGSSLTVAIDSYDRSWARSASVLRLRSSDGTDFAELKSTWRHGPLGGLNLASGSSEFRLLGPVAPLGTYIFGNDAPATAAHTVALDQSLRVDFATPPVDRALDDSPSMRVSTSGSSGTFTLDRAGRYALDYLHPKLAFTGPSERVEIDTVQLASAGGIGDAVLRTPARFSLSAKSIQGGANARAISIADVAITFRMIPNAESIDFKLGHVVGAGHVEGGGNAHRWKRIEFQMTLADISRAALEGYSREMRSIAALPASEQQRSLELGLAAHANAAKLMLQRDPSLSIDTLAFEGPDGTLSVTATARVDRALLGSGGLDALPQAIAVVARVSIARALAQAWLGAALRPNAIVALAVQGGPEPSAADVDRSSRTMAGNVLDAAARAGLFREGADPIVIEIVAKEGRVLANGLSPERLAELRAALMPDPTPRNRTIPAAR